MSASRATIYDVYRDPDDHSFARLPGLVRDAFVLVRRAAHRELRLTLALQVVSCSARGSSAALGSSRMRKGAPRPTRTGLASKVAHASQAATVDRLREVGLLVGALQACHQQPTVLGVDDARPQPL
ncbi:MAG: hypothetical protein ACRD1K_04700 [Acidimicrobiales bacterium]